MSLQGLLKCLDGWQTRKRESGEEGQRMNTLSDQPPYFTQNWGISPGTQFPVLKAPVPDKLGRAVMLHRSQNLSPAGPKALPQGLQKQLSEQRTAGTEADSWTLSSWGPASEPRKNWIRARGTDPRLSKLFGPEPRVMLEGSRPLKMGQQSKKGVWLLTKLESHVDWSLYMHI